MLLQIAISAAQPAIMESRRNINIILHGYIVKRYFHHWESDTEFQNIAPTEIIRFRDSKIFHPSSGKMFLVYNLK